MLVSPAAAAASDLAEEEATALGVCRPQKSEIWSSTDCFEVSMLATEDDFFLSSLDLDFAAPNVIFGTCSVLPYFLP